MALTLYPPDNLPVEPAISVFLAGTIDMGASLDWQAEFIAAVGDRPYTVFNPRRPDWDASWGQDITCPKFTQQVEWELDRLNRADVVAFHFEPGSMSPVTMLELGLMVATKPHRTLVSCPEGFWRRGNIQIVCRQYGIDVLDGVADLVAHSRAILDPLLGDFG